jgi:hypothetical protein
MKPQTAVDYLLDQLPNKHELRYQLNQKGVIKKAKEMEQEQIIKAHINGQPLYSCQSEKAEQYYNETYNNK